MTRSPDDLPGPAGLAFDAWRATRGGSAAIAARQARRLGALVAHARRASRFYAEHYRDVPAAITRPDDLSLLPPVGKPALMAAFDDWVTDPAVTRQGVGAFLADLGNVGRDYLDRYVVFTTSGSTGTPAVLIQDRRAIAVMMALAYARSSGVLPPRLVGRILARGARQAAVFARGGHFLTATMSERRLRAHPSRARFTRFYSILDPLPELVRQLNEFQPVLISTYSSALSVLTAEQEAGHLRISPLVISCGGEQLLPAVRRRAEAVFACTVVETYNVSEATPLSMPCRWGRHHVNTDWFIIEPVDSAGRLVAPGDRSDSLLLTNLANYAQPVIRYELADSVVVDPLRCPCGNPLPTVQVEGRTDEILRVSRPAGGYAVLLPMALATEVEETPGVRRFQILQTSSASLSVRLETVPGADRDQVWQLVRDRLARLLRAQGAEAALELAREAPQVNPRSGKLRHVLRALPTEQPTGQSAGQLADPPKARSAPLPRSS